MKIGSSRTERPEKEEADRKRKAEIKTAALKRNIPCPHCSVSAMAMNFFRNASTEEIVINTLNNEANSHKVSFDYCPVGDGTFKVSMEGKLLCRKSFDEMELLLQDSLNTYNAFWSNIIENALSTDLK